METRPYGVWHGLQRPIRPDRGYQVADPDVVAVEATRGSQCCRLGDRRGVRQEPTMALPEAVWLSVVEAEPWQGECWDSIGVSFSTPINPGGNAYGFTGRASRPLVNACVGSKSEVQRTARPLAFTNALSAQFLRRSLCRTKGRRSGLIRCLSRVHGNPPLKSERWRSGFYFDGPQGVPCAKGVDHDRGGRCGVQESSSPPRIGLLRRLWIVPTAYAEDPLEAPSEISHWGLTRMTIDHTTRCLSKLSELPHSPFSYRQGIPLQLCSGSLRYDFSPQWLMQLVATLHAFDQFIISPLNDCSGFLAVATCIDSIPR
ncbi:hypothetical protein R1flu_005973 [Riccia fluitans]|uniref:Uncharacterized protein n=1 Tax=Riccia fluitans TaxID=41844 RepID=A0ABD1YXG6_9MARC